MSSVFWLTVRQLTGKWRLLIMTPLAMVPVVFTAFIVRLSPTPFVGEFEIIVISTMLVGTIAPLIVVSIASVGFSNEIEDRTLANLTLSPIPRWKIVVPKLAGAIAVAAPFILASALATSFLAYNRDATAVVAVTLSVFVGLAAYSSVFVWLGLVTKQAIGVGLLFIVLWEGFFSGYVSGIRLVSIRFYTVAMIHGLDPRRFVADRHVPLEPAIWVLVGTVGLFLWLSVQRLRRMDVP
ncbi:MAG: ABC transporter permease [Longimicrobiales bacterium]